MGDAAHNIDPPFRNPERDLTLVHSNDRQPTDSQESSTEVLYPDLTFDIPERKIVNTDARVIPVTEASRLRTVLHELKFATEKLPENEEFNRYYSDTKLRETQIAKAATYLDEPVMIGGRVQKHADVVDISRAMNDAYVSLVEENHPVGQVMDYLSATHGPKLTERERNTLFLDLLTITCWDRLRSSADKQIARAILEAEAGKE